MASTRHDRFLADFNTRYARWVTAQETGDLGELRTAEAALPSLNARLRMRLAMLDEDITDLAQRATEKRLAVLLAEMQVDKARRLKKRREAEKRRQNHTFRISRTVELPTKCVRCGAKLDVPKTTGRPRVYCSPACRKAAYEDRHAHHNDAVKVQVVEKVITEVRERRIEVPHPRSECIQAVFADDDSLIEVIRALIEEVQDSKRTAFGPEQHRFWDLYTHVEALHEAIVRRAEHGTPPMSEETPMSRSQINMQRMTYPGFAGLDHLE